MEGCGRYGSVTRKISSVRYTSNTSLRVRRRRSRSREDLSENQLERTLEAKDIVQGSPEWWSVLLKAPAGTFVGLSINAAAAART